ncbi:MAG: protein-S-isoprenylcysteine O-methyltransferase Ste14 [Candidatus Poriferisodalaceae bacterium]|jgi:protein-S-isoprenylcysteine O-methyltransferase Ste14
MTDQQKAYAFVGVQAVLLLVIVLAPAGTAWTVTSSMRTVAAALVAIGVVIGVLAALQLRRGLTAMPLPSPRGQLVTNGLFAYIRHPIYVGVIVLCAGMALRSGSLVHVVVLFVLVAFFWIKAGWEEQRLAERYPDYAGYTTRTGRLLPRLRSRA